LTQRKKYLTGDKDFFTELGLSVPGRLGPHTMYLLTLEDGWYAYEEVYWEEEDRWVDAELWERNRPLTEEDERHLKNIFAASELGKGRHSFTGAQIAEMQLPEIRVVVGPWLPVGGQCLLVGEDGIGKTFLAMQLIEALVTGSDFLGYPAQESRVALVEVDMGDRLTLERVQEMKLDQSNFLVSVGALDKSITQTGHTEDWVSEINDFKPEVIVFDSLRELHTLDENSSDTPPKVYMACRKLFGEDKTFIFVHHTRKASREQNGLNTHAGQDYRGSSAWRASVDVEIMLSPIRAGQVQISFPKTRICAPQDSFPAELNQNTLRFEKADALSEGFAGAHGTSAEVFKELVKRNP
jgi:archaellum biogenesis ATPase FlaH